jgi:hypothetical protein
MDERVTEYVRVWSLIGCYFAFVSCPPTSITQRSRCLLLHSSEGILCAVQGSSCTLGPETIIYHILRAASFYDFNNQGN